LDDSQRVLTAALSAGFRESGAVSLSASKSTEANPIVAVRSTGYSFDAIIGYQDEQGENIALVDEAYLQTLVAISNERFQVNEERISRFRSALLNQYDRDRIVCTATPKPDWEDAETRRQRKRQEGLARKKQLEAQKTGKSTPYSPDAHEHLNYDLAFADASSS
jgi:tRNA wybutosine-synthesizing protein 3